MKNLKVSRRALEGRVRRALAKQDELLCKCRTDSRWYGDLGDYYIADAQTNGVIAQHVDLEELAGELNLLKSAEVLAD